MMEASSDLDSHRSEPDHEADGNSEPEIFSGARCSIPHRKLAAVEIPAVVNNIDRAVKTFGRGQTLQHVMDPGMNSIPLYLNPESAFCKPLMSHNARAHNVVLKITVPKRTGRKRKRGSNGRWHGDVDVSDDLADGHGKVASVARQDEPDMLRKRLSDNVGRYQVEAVGVVGHTHRFRGLADFYWNTGARSDFARRYRDLALAGDVQKLKQFQFSPGIDKGPNVDIIPPPVFSHMRLPFNYAYSQNPYIHHMDDGRTVNTTAVKHIGYSIGADDPIPSGPQHAPDMTDARTVEVLAEIEAAFEERPVYTRRSLMNRLGDSMRNWNELKKYLSYAAYQFKGGPWRDTVVPYGLDPRHDPKYRIYQTVMFKLPRHTIDAHSPPWYSLHGVQQDPENEFQPEQYTSHLFDGDTFHMDGKVWQVCDITDPIIKELFDNAAVRPERHPDSGWYHGALWAKAKGIMKTKLVGIRFGQSFTKEDFHMTLAVRDETPERVGAPTAGLPLPTLTYMEGSLRGQPIRIKGHSLGYNVRIRTKAGDGAEGEAEVEGDGGGEGEHMEHMEHMDEMEEMSQEEHDLEESDMDSDVEDFEERRVHFAEEPDFDPNIDPNLMAAE